MAITVAVYEKRGLKRGPGITDAHFREWPFQPDDELPFTGAGPLGEPVYLVESPWWRYGNLWTLGVYAPRHQSWQFDVRDGETHEVWLSPA
jgi:hypothetical protein